ncbi:m-phase inducer phosphatase [Coemansia sp. RSA 1722]|nr:m-phase inducer phosphatase [Coemansia sp. RSA 485]KAJ2594358.1 m-phase inducer phosphatase [Coemansia sp. RSA 1722]
MHTVASADQLQTSSYLGVMSTPNPFNDGISTPCKTATPPRHSRLSLTGTETTQTCTTAVSGSTSPIGTLVKDIQSSLHLKGTLKLDRDNMKPPPSFEPFKCESPFEIKTQSTPLMFRSRKRLLEEMSPGLGPIADSPTPAFCSRKKGRKLRGSVLAVSPGLCGTTLFSCEGKSAEDDSSFGDDSSLSQMPCIQASTTHNYTLEETPLDTTQLDSTPCRSLASRAKRIRSISKRIRSPSKLIPTFLPIQEECDAELAKTPSRTPASAASASGTPATIDTASFLSPPSRRISSTAAAAAATPSSQPPFSPFAKSRPECHLLPCSSASTDSIMRIEAQIVSELLSGQYDSLYDEKIFVDCRFPYEYEGGHIAGASNAPTLEALEKLLLERPISDKRVVVVLHCEYSIQRAPSMASYLRRRDREVNAHRYPNLHYPEIYVLKGGYRNFFSYFKPQCEPQNYVEMNDEAFANDCRQRMMQFSRQFKRTKSMNDVSLGRSKSYSSLTVPSPSALFGNMQSPTPPMLNAGRSISSSTLPVRPRRMARTQSARPGIHQIDFSQK